MKMLIAVSLTLFSICCVGCGSQSSSSLFHQGRGQLMKGEFAQADKLLSQFETAHKQHELLPRAAFLRGKAQLGLGDLNSAETHFRRVISRFPSSEESHKSQYKLGFIELLRGEDTAAQEIFQQIVDRPKGTLVPEAKVMLKYLDRDDRGGNEPAP